MAVLSAAYVLFHGLILEDEPAGMFVYWVKVKPRISEEEKDINEDELVGRLRMLFRDTTHAVCTGAAANAGRRRQIKVGVKVLFVPVQLLPHHFS